MTIDIPFQNFNLNKIHNENMRFWINNAFNVLGGDCFFGNIVF